MGDLAGELLLGDGVAGVDADEAGQVGDAVIDAFVHSIVFQETEKSRG